MLALHAIIKWLARASAAVGGIVLTSLIILTTLSIIGRTISKAANGEVLSSAAAWFAAWVNRVGIDEINGTYELTEVGVAFAIFSFFPICQFYGAHATVDVFTSALPDRMNRILRAFWEIVLTATLIFITFRLYDGMLRYLKNGETTLFLQFPVWWGYGASLGAAIIACVVGVYCAAARVGEMTSGRSVLPQGE